MNFDKGKRYGVTAVSGTMAAALAANSTVFGMYLPVAATVRARIEHLRMQWQCITGFTTPISAGRRLAAYRGKATGVLTLGTQIASPAAKRARNVGLSAFDNANGGDIRVATTVALGVGNLTSTEAVPFNLNMVSKYGAAGDFVDFAADFDPIIGNELVLEPGEILLIQNPQVMDAVGTWQLAIGVGWRETDAGAVIA